VQKQKRNSSCSDTAARMMRGDFTSILREFSWCDTASCPRDEQRAPRHVAGHARGALSQAVSPMAAGRPA
jgi:hypothetical protein